MATFSMYGFVIKFWQVNLWHSKQINLTFKIHFIQSLSLTYDMTYRWIQKSTIICSYDLIHTYINPLWSYVRLCPTLWFSCSWRFSWSLTLSNPIFLPPAYSPACVYIYIYIYMIYLLFGLINYEMLKSHVGAVALHCTCLLAMHTHPIYTLLSYGFFLFLNVKEYLQGPVTIVS
jgi:hypothetical protein